MSDAKHTPGPWRDAHHDGYESDRFSWITAADGEPVVEYEGCGSHRAKWRSKADFALALAAPDLLAACKRALSFITEDVVERDVLVSAVAKATGK